MDSLKRLERAGSAQSKAAEKLHEAAEEVAVAIINAVPDNMVGDWLPRDYRVVYRKSNVGGKYYLTREDGEETHYIDGMGKNGGYMHGDFHCWIPGQTREGSLLFAKDLAGGLLDMIAKHIEEQTQKIEIATEIATKK
jgi:hypothetical protein